MSGEELEAVLTGGESQNVEFKSALPEGGKIRETVCAFANDLHDSGKPGVLFIGINKDGTNAKLVINDRLLTTLADLRSDGNTLPSPQISVEKRS